MATYIRYAHKARKLTVDLGTARDNVHLEGPITALRILDKGTGNFTLHLEFFDGTKFDLTQAEVSNGDLFRWDIEDLRITNTAQAGLTLKLIVEMQVPRE